MNDLPTSAVCLLNPCVALCPAAAAAAPAPASDQPVFTRLELRVGKIVSADLHPNAERMYVEQIDVGEGKPRQICSGLVCI